MILGCSCTARAQLGGHEHIAPLAPTATIPTDRISPLLNRADGVWNNGEAGLADTGGVLTADNNPGSVVGNGLVQTLQNWAPHHLPNVERFVGEIRSPAGADAPTQSSSFAIYRPTNLEASKITVCVISVNHTSRSIEETNRPFDPYIYPGDPNNFGLWTFAPFPYPDILVANFGQGTQDFQVVGAQLVTRVSDRPLEFAIQRVRQLRHAVFDRLLQDVGIEEDMVVFMVGGGSFGGMTTLGCVLLYPDEFHGGLSSGYSPQHGALTSDQENNNFMVAPLGRPVSGAGYTMDDALHWSIMQKLQGTNHAHGMSLVNRARHGDVRRPIYCMVGDEDPVSHGNEWIRLLSGGAYQDSGSVQTPGIYGSKVYWSVVGKACHATAAYADPYRIDGQGPWRHEPREAADFMIPLVALEHGRHVPPPPKARGLHSSFTTPNAEPFDHAHGRKGIRTAPAGQNQGLLVEATGFKRHGHGTWLGMSESLVVAKPTSTAPKASVYVGGAAGVVTRFEAATIQPGLEPLLEMAQSRALGYGAWGMAVGDVDPNRPGNEVVVATHRRLSILDATTLTVVRESDFTTVPDPRNYTRPRRLQLTDIHSTNAGLEIIFTTVPGKIAVFNGQLQQLGYHEESGVIDLAVGPQPTLRVPNTDFTLPIFLLSARGHVASLELDSNIMTGPQGRLSAVSKLQYGDTHDLEVVQWSGQPALAGLFSGAPTGHGSVRIFNPSTMDVIAEFGRIESPAKGIPPPPPPGIPVYEEKLIGNPLNGFEACLSVANDASGQHFVVLNNDHLIVFPPGGSWGRLKRLDTFPPLRWHSAMATGDIDPASPGDEIVIATQAGRVVWLKLSDVMTAGESLGLTRNVQKVGGVNHDHRTNYGAPAAWALGLHPFTGVQPTPSLHAVDQNGTWWTVNPQNGDLSHVPARDLPTSGVTTLSYLGNGISAQLSGTGGTGHRFFDAQAVGGPFDRAVHSRPYLPTTPDPSGQWQLASDPPLAPISGDFLVGFRGSAVFRQSSRSVAAHWPQSGYPNLVQGFGYDESTKVVLDLWNSTGPPQSGGIHPPRPTAPDNGIQLRTEDIFVGAYEMQNIAVGPIRSSVPEAVVSTWGGKAILLADQTGAIVAPSIDLGSSGMALDTADLDPSTPGIHEVVFAPCYDPVGINADRASSTLRVLSWANGWNTLGSLAVGDPNAPNHDFTGYGVCGAHVFDRDPTSSTDEPLILVTTVSGEMLVVEWNRSSQSFGPIQWRHIVDGSIGAFQSVVVADLVSTNGTKPEIYISGEMGMRRFDVQ